jgi:hypothetical protein
MKLRKRERHILTLLLTNPLFELLSGSYERLQHLLSLIARDEEGARGPFLAIWTNHYAVDSQDAVLIHNRFDGVDEGYGQWTSSPLPK